MKNKDRFSQLKPGMKVHDTWYGNGKVIRVNSRYVYIKLASLVKHIDGNVYQKSDEPVRYDRSHVNRYIRKGYKKC